MWNKNIETFIGLDASFDEAKCVVFGAPMDATTSFRPGTRFASTTMRKESFGLETYSPYQDKDLEEIKVFDGGDLELPFGAPRKALDMIKETTAKILAANKIPCMIGGEHLVSLGAIEAAVEKYPELRIIHFDAHTDLREEYLGEKLSHASVIKRAYDLVGDHKIYQYGIRSGEREEFYFAREHTFLNKFNFDNLDKAINECQGYPVYFTIDLDVLDPGFFPGTGTPEAGGVSFMELLAAILKVSQLNVVAMDINELAPVYDPSGVSTALACKVLRELLLAINKGER